MAVYQPPDSVLVAIGAAYPGAPLVAAGRRLVARVRGVQPALGRFGLGFDAVDAVEGQLDGLERALSSSRAQKHDTTLQMAEAVELMARARGWLHTLRLVASVNLGADTPALYRLSSPEPELVEGYPRDVVEELERRLAAARDLAPRLGDAGLDRAFLTLGRRIAAQLRTAVGPRDLRPEDLELELRRLYLRKGSLYLTLKRWTRIGKLAFVDGDASGWDLAELEPVRTIPLSAG